MTARAETITVPVALFTGIALALDEIASTIEALAERQDAVDQLLDFLVERATEQETAELAAA